jgi:hypothetical protein
LYKNYDPITGNIRGPIGYFPIQSTVTPHGKYMVTANTGSTIIIILDTETDEIIKELPCDAGCHGANFRAKKRGSNYAYVSSSPRVNRAYCMDCN